LIHFLLWADNAEPYLDAIKAAGLADRVAVDACRARSSHRRDRREE